MATPELIEAVAVTAELCGREISAGAARVMLADLQGFPEPAVFGALKRCRREVRGTLTVQDIVSRLDDGRPGPDEAWSLIPQDELRSVVWSDEMATAFGVALPLLQVGDRVAARFAFREAYVKAVGDARDACRPARWTPSLGLDPQGREQALREAVDRGRIGIDMARALVRELPAPAQNIEALARGAIAFTGADA
jgi:hypothetical protein